MPDANPDYLAACPFCGRGSPVKILTEDEVDEPEVPSTIPMYVVDRGGVLRDGTGPVTHHTTVT